MFTTYFIVASPDPLQNKTFGVLACLMKQAMSVLSDNGFWLVLAMLLSNFCAARELSLYRVDGNEGNVKLHRTGHSSTAGKSSTIVDDSPKDSYVKAAVGYQHDKDAKYRSEEAKLHQERRLMFFRNLQLGSMAQSLRPEDTYQIGSLSTYHSMPIGPLEPTYQIGTTWNVLNTALDADRAQEVGYQIDSSRLAVPALSDLDELEELVERANAYAGFETEGAVNDGQGGEQVDADEAEEEATENTYTVEFEAPQLRGGTTKTRGATKSPKKTKGEKSKKMKAKTSTALKSKKGPSKDPKVLKSTKQAKGGKKKASEKKSKQVKSTKSLKV